MIFKTISQRLLIAALFAVVLAGCGKEAPATSAATAPTPSAVAPSLSAPPPAPSLAASAPTVATPGPTTGKNAVATFGGGCFWCVEEAFDAVPGVITTTSGYMGGHTKNPTYNQVSSGGTGHNEVVQVAYDPAKISYAQLLDVFWKNIDPTQANGQFCDHGSQYRSEIFYHDEDQRKAAEASKAALLKTKPFTGDIHTLITRASEFTAAEEYHQDYYRKNPLRYKYYKTSCGRVEQLKEVWKTR